MKYKVTTKTEKGWRTYGNGKVNDKGSINIGFKVTPELIELFNAKMGQFINFTLFDAEDKPREVPEQAKEELSQLYDEIPF